MGAHYAMEIKLHWIVQSNITLIGDSTQRLVYTLQELKQPYTTFEYIPFKGTDYGFFDDIKNPAIFCGTLNSLLDIVDRVKVLPKPFSWHSSVDCSDYYPKYQELLLQTNYKFLKLGEVPDDTEIKQFAVNDKIFIRPNDNKKTFAGQLVNVDCLYGWMGYTKDILGNDKDLEVIASKPVKLFGEWRFIILNKKVVTGSKYRSENSLDVEEGYDEKAAEFAEIAANKWSPAPLFIIDVGLTNEGYKIVEIGPFSYAGFYKCNLKKTITEISSFFENSYDCVGVCSPSNYS